MQPYSKPVSFQEIQCSGEVNIYLHNLTLLSDCLIFPSDFPLLFSSTPKLSFKTSSTKKKDMSSPEDPGLSDPDDATYALRYSPELPGRALRPASQLPLFCCITYKSSSSTYKAYLHLFLPPHPKFSGCLPHPTPPHPTPPPLFFLLLLLLLLSFSPPGQPSAASP